MDPHLDTIVRKSLPPDLYDAYILKRISIAKRFNAAISPAWRLYAADTISRDEYLKRIAADKARYEAESVQAFHKAMENCNEFCPSHS